MSQAEAKRRRMTPGVAFFPRSFRLGFIIFPGDTLQQGVPVRFIVSVPHHRAERLKRRFDIGLADPVVGEHPEAGRPRMREHHPLLSLRRAMNASSVKR